MSWFSVQPRYSRTRTPSKSNNFSSPLIKATNTCSPYCGVCNGVGNGVEEGVGNGVEEGVGNGIEEGVGNGVEEGVGNGVEEGLVMG